MREVGITNSTDGLETTFKTIVDLSRECKFNDCSHTTETGCAVMSALESGEIDESSYENYMKMGREKDHYESTIAVRRKKDKSFGKMVNKAVKNKNLNKY